MKIYFIPFNKKSLIIVGMIILVLIVIFMFLFFSLKSTSSFSHKPIYEVETAKDEIALTCNVVWGTEYVPDMLNILKNEDVKMTFYIGGKWAEENPDLLKKIYSQGHEIGNHGYDHKKPSETSDADNKSEITQAEKVIEDIIDTKTKLFAPPYGDIDERTAEIAENLGYKVIMWNIDTIDWKYKDPQVIHDRVFKNDLGGGIVLMHPTDGTVKALPSIIKDIKNQDINIVTVSELIEK